MTPLEIGTAMLLLAYELNGNRMCCGFTEPAPAPATMEIVDPNKFNEIDAIASGKVPPVIVLQDDRDDPPASRHGRSHGNICERHGMHKVTYGDKWRCRK